MKQTLNQIFKHMLEDCTDICDGVKRVKTREGMDSDNLIRKGMVHSILNLGELTKILEKRIDITDSDVNWKGLKGMRDIAAHRYHSMNSEIIWEVAVNHIPEIYTYLSEKYQSLSARSLKEEFET